MPVADAPPPLRHNVRPWGECERCEELRALPKARYDVILIAHDEYVFGYHDGYDDRAGDRPRGRWR